MRSPPRFAIIALSYSLLAPLSADVFTNVPEATAEGYEILYEIDMPDNGGFRDGTPVPYLIDNSATASAYNRIAYYIEVDDGSGVDWVFVSLPSFDNDPTRIGLPHNANNPVLRQHRLENINVLSNVAGVTTGNGIANGGVEMWPGGYATDNDFNVAGADGNTYDFGDGSPSLAAGYGSFQIHNRGTNETIFAWNGWGDPSRVDDIGIGTRASSHPDWTFAANATSYTVKSFQVLVRPTQPIPAPAAFALRAPEAANYNLVYELDIADVNNFSAGVGYTINNAAAHPLDSIGRVAYMLELDSDWVWVSADAVQNDPELIGMPTTQAHLQRAILSNMNVFASATSGVTPATGSATGNIEFYPINYSSVGAPPVPSGNDSQYDFDDTPSIDGSFGSLQIHNHGAPTQTLLAFNNWKHTTNASDIGLGNRPTSHPDWTFAANAAGFTTRKLYVLIEPAPYTVSFTEFPQPFQLFPRDQITNTAQVAVAGTETMGNYTHAILRTYRDDVQVGADDEQALTYTDGVAAFAFSSTITAELALYDLEILLRDGSGDITVRRFEDLLAGDVMIIQGQSNADAQLYSGSASSYSSPYVRSFGLNTADANGTAFSTNWLQATGDGSRDRFGGIGQWGLVMGKQIADQTGIPLAILNGAHGGQPIGFFQRNDGDTENLNTNYGRLLHRMRLAAIDQNVRTILFYQGESDNDDGPVHEAGYEALVDDWTEDFPTTEQFYVFQVRDGCGVTHFDVDLRDRQRRFADNLPNHSVFTTHGLDGHDGCHYAFANGYENAGLNIARLVQRDLFAVPADDAEAPNPASVELVGPTFDVARITLRNTTDTLTFDAGAEADFALLNSAVTITSGAIVNGAIELQLSGNAEGATAVTYTGHSGAGPWVTNANGIGLLTFSETLPSPGPQVEFTSPVGSMEGTPGTPIALAATATPLGSPVTLLELFVGSNLIASVSSTETINGSFTPPSGPGAYEISVRATDATATSRTRSFFVFIGLDTTPGGVGAGLQVWLRPQVGISFDANDNVETWADQSGNGHDASQSTTARRPEFVENAFGCNPGFRYAGNHSLDSTTGMPNGSYTKVVQYIREVNVGNANLLSSTTGGAGSHAFFHTSGDFSAIYHGIKFVDSITPVLIDQATASAATYDTATNLGQIFVDGVFAGSGAAANDSSSPTFQIGAFISSAHFNGIIGEILIYDRVLTQAELDAVGAYLAGTCATPYQRWRTDTPGGLDEDADDDGLTAPLEYAFGTDPLQADPGPPTSMTEPSPGQLATVTYRRPLNFDHVRYNIEIAGDLLNWQPAVITNLTTTPTPGDPNSETVTAEIDLSALPNEDVLFYRFDVTVD